jgi:hypothetical protein
LPVPEVWSCVDDKIIARSAKEELRSGLGDRSRPFASRRARPLCGGGGSPWRCVGPALWRGLLGSHLMRFRMRSYMLSSVRIGWVRGWLTGPLSSGQTRRGIR